MKILSIYTAAVWALLLVYTYVPHAGGSLGPLHWLALVGARVIPGGELWRVLTYVLIENPANFGPLWSILTFWLIGSPVEQAAGPRLVAQLLIAGTLGGAVFALVASQLTIELYTEPVVGMGAISGALLAGWGFLNARQQAMIFPGTPAMRGSTLAWIFTGLAVFFAVMNHSATSIASVGGIAGGAAWMWLRSRIGQSTRGRGSSRGRRPSGEHLRSIRGGRSGSDRTIWN